MNKTFLKPKTDNNSANGHSPECLYDTVEGVPHHDTEKNYYESQTYLGVTPAEFFSSEWPDYPWFAKTRVHPSMDFQKPSI